MGLVTGELLSVAAGEVQDASRILPLQRELQGADLATGPEGARRPQKRSDRPEGGHCGYGETKAWKEGKNGTI